MEGASSFSSQSPIFKNYVLVSALMAIVISQSVKFFASWYKERRFDLKWLVGSGGMPSSHSATVTALATAIGLQDGLGGSDFAMALILACIVSHDFLCPFDAGRDWDELMKLSKMIRSKYSPSVSEVLWSKNYFISRIDYDFWQVTYDATGVRLHAGRQAEVLNQIVYGLSAEHPLAESRPLNELLGHTPPQVIMGCLLGIVTASAGYLTIRVPW